MNGDIGNTGQSVFKVPPQRTVVFNLATMDKRVKTEMRYRTSVAHCLAGAWIII